MKKNTLENKDINKAIKTLASESIKISFLLDRALLKNINLKSSNKDSIRYQDVTDKQIRLGVKESIIKIKNTMHALKDFDKMFENIKILIDSYENYNNMHDANKRLAKSADALRQILKQKNTQDTKTIRRFDIESIPIPTPIRSALISDFKEMLKCFLDNSFRATTILCGRILETTLHRKYYETTGNDILETNPGIGLGKLIAVLRQKEIEIDPGLTDQIHMINKIRIHSVHIKKDNFEPSKEQTEAMILYTYDTIKKFFH